jgi:cardiolipin synthase
VLNIPNFLTLLRIAAIPVFLIFLGDHRYGHALAIFVAAGVTDALDGAIARLMHSKTTLGAYLDPAADKLLLLSAFISLAFLNEVPRWLVVIVLSRDVVVVLGYFLLFTMTQETMEVRPTVAGKLATFFQLGSVAFVLVGLVRPDLVRPMVPQLFFYSAGLLTTVAGIQYVYRGLVWVQVRGDA